MFHTRFWQLGLSRISERGKESERENELRIRSEVFFGPLGPLGPLNPLPAPSLKCSSFRPRGESRVRGPTAPDPVSESLESTAGLYAQSCLLGCSI